MAARLARLAVPGVANVCFVEGLENVVTTNSRRDPVLPKKEDSPPASACYECRTSQARWNHAIAGRGRALKLFLQGAHHASGSRTMGIYFLPEGSFFQAAKVHLARIELATFSV